MANETTRYSRVAAVLHWIIAAMVIAIIVLGIGGESVGAIFGMDGLATIFLHKSLGLTVFVLTAVRLGWRLTHPVPPLPESTPPWQRRAAHGAHIALYALMLGLPVTGYMLSSKSRFPLEWFGNELPKLPLPELLAEAANQAHVVGGLTMAALVVVHIGAALWHHFVMRDGLISRMRLGGGA